MPARLTALLIGILALAVLRARHDGLPASVAELSLGLRLWHLSGHYAVMTGLLSAAAFLAMARGWRIGPRLAGALALALALSALTTLAVPSPAFPAFSTEWIGHRGLSLGLPLAGLAWWAAFAPKGLGRPDLSGLLAWPLAFLAMSLARATLGEMPEPFLSPPLTLTMALFLALAILLSLGLIGLAKVLNRG
jgi:hypothetical protein